MLKRILNVHLCIYNGQFLFLVFHGTFWKYLQLHHVGDLCVTDGATTLSTSYIVSTRLAEAAVSAGNQSSQIFISIAKIACAMSRAQGWQQTRMGRQIGWDWREAIWTIWLEGTGRTDWLRSVLHHWSLAEANLWWERSWKWLVRIGVMRKPHPREHWWSFVR